MKKTKALKFSPGVNDALLFKDKFLQIYANDDADCGKFQLVEFYRTEDDYHFQNLIDQGKSLNELLEAFVLKYQPMRGERLRTLNQSMDTTEHLLNLTKLKKWYDN